SSILHVDLFAHIKNMGWTTFPAFFISLVMFAFISPSMQHADFSGIETFKLGLLDTGLISWDRAIIPIVILVVFSIKKAPALLALAAGTVSAIIVSFFHEVLPVGEILTILFEGFAADTGVEEIDELLTGVGMGSMFSTIGIVLLDVRLGGLLFTLGI